MNFIRYGWSGGSGGWPGLRLAQLLDDLQLWEIQGRDLLAQVVELTEPGDDLHEEAARVLDLLSGP